MREVVLLVPGAAVEDVLDRVLPMVPGGVREVPAGRHVELRLRGTEVPSVRDLKRAAGRRVLRVSEREISDDWRERRVADYVPDVIDGRLVVRPEWAPAAGSGLLEIVLSEGPAFGTGTHPTTRTCLSFMLDVEPGGSFADLGCGTGVLAILAAKLGFGPVAAFDVLPESVERARSNAAANGVEVEVALRDLLAEPAPAADAMVANVPPAVHQGLVEALPGHRPRFLIVSGFSDQQAGDVLGGYAGSGLRVRRRADVNGWVVAVLA